MRRLSALLVCLLCLPVMAQRPQAPAVSTPESAALAVGGNEFAVNLYAQLRSQKGNLFFSPESLSTALAMAWAGARGETASDMARTLHFTLPPEQLHPAMGALLNDLNAPHASYHLSVANALWAQSGATLLPAFIDIMNKDYGAGFQEVDFRSRTEEARGVINRWVEQKTAGKIKDLLQSGVLKPTTRLVLTNAIYFRGDWQTPFEQTQTRDEDFHPSAGATLQTPLMHRTGSFDYFYFDGGAFQALEIPYKGNELAMVILLPKDAGGLASFESSITPAKLQSWLKQLTPAPRVEVTLPKFQMTREFSLGRTLGEMGMGRAFGPAADFSGMTGKRDFAISDVIHKAYLDVNETGTEAAAATGATLRTLMMRGPDRTLPVIFRADHPFLFLIQDIHSGNILFLGRLENPKS